jgi:DNA-directed RNA polymerase specialized sigma subunit
MSQKRIAALLRIHQTTVSQHILYALKKLRQALGG